MTDSLDAFLNAAFWKAAVNQADAILAAHPDLPARSIHAAATLGDDAAVRAHIARDPSAATTKSGPDNLDPLTYLCFSTYLAHDPARTDGFVRTATTLLDAGADPNTGFFSEDHGPAGMWERALYGAAGVAHHPEVTRLLIERGADPNDPEVVYHSPETLDNRAMKIIVETGRLTPESLAMMLARKFDWHDDLGVSWLLDHGVDPNHLGRWGKRPMHHALACGNPLNYFEQLIDHGADPTLPGDGPTLFAGAARLGRVDVLDLFERRGFHLELTGDDAFVVAAARGDAAGTRRIIADDPSIVSRIQSRDPDFLVDFAGAADLAAVRLLLDLGFYVAAARVEPPWRKGETALHVAAWRGRTAMAQLLIDRGAPLEIELHSGETPLGLALRGLVDQSEWTPNDGSVAIARALIRAGARLDAAEMTLAAAICLDRDEDVARLLPTASDEDLRKALSATAYNGKVEGMRRLIARGAPVNGFNAGLNPTATALHNAANSGSLEAVKLLVEAGAKVDVRDSWWQATPLDWAAWYARESARNGDARQYVEIVAYLEAATKSP